MRFTPRGVTDAFDATDAFPGACQQLVNLVFDQSNPELVVSRPGVLTLASFTQAGFVAPGFISIQVGIGTRIYGMIATSRNAGKDEPFCYETATGAFIPVSGITGALCPTSPATTGDWVPPTIATIGVMVIVTHPGFPGGGTKFGWFDVSTPASPVWHAGDTATNGLIGTPQAVANFNNRAYFAVGNQLEFTDVLTNPPTITNASQALTIGDSQVINALSGLPLQTTSSGILATLTVFKVSQVWQIAGDPTFSNISEQYMSLSIGTTAPRSVVQSTLGVYFIGSGGPYMIDQLGTLRSLTSGIDKLNPDLLAPFQNAVTPTRWAGAFTSSIYRICGPTIVHGQQIVGDYWFDEHKRRWTGPHTFAYDCATAVNGFFVLSSVNAGGLLLQQTPNQTIGSIFTDLGTSISILLQSSTFPKTSDMCMKQVAESQIELSASGGTVTYTITAQDEQNNTLDSVVLSVNKFGSTWGGTFWGASTWAHSNVWGGGGVWGTIAEGGSGGVWMSGQQVPETFPVSWDAPFVFEKMQLNIAATASANVGIGTFYARYQKTGYMTLGM
jgi:hypothetical protein